MVEYWLTIFGEPTCYSFRKLCQQNKSSCRSSACGVLSLPAFVPGAASECRGSLDNIDT